MEQVNKQKPLDAGRMRSILRQRKSIKRRFDLHDIKPQVIMEMLTDAYDVEVNARHGTVVVDDDFREHIKRVAKWMFFPQPLSLALFGGVGNGKTTMLKAVTDVIDYVAMERGEYQCKSMVRFVTARDVANAMMKAYSDKHDDTEFRNLCSAQILAIDDLGTEPQEMLVYGNPINPMRELLYYRYENQLCTMITSNIYPSKIAEVYGERVADRMREQFEIIAYNNKSYRVKPDVTQEN